MNPDIVPSQTSNSFKDIFKGNSKMLFLLIIASIVFIIIIVTIIVMNNALQPSANTSTPEITQAATSTPTRIPTLAPQPTKTITSQEQSTIVTQVQPKLKELITVPYTVAKVKAYGDQWAIMEVTNPTTDPANIVVKKVNGTWQVMLGPGTHFDRSSLDAIGAPQNLSQDANGAL